MTQRWVKHRTNCNITMAFCPISASSGPAMAYLQKPPMTGTCDEKETWASGWVRHTLGSSSCPLQQRSSAVPCPWRLGYGGVNTQQVGKRALWVRPAVPKERRCRSFLKHSSVKASIQVEASFSQWQELPGNYSWPSRIRSECCFTFWNKGEVVISRATRSNDSFTVRWKKLDRDREKTCRCSMSRRCKNYKVTLIIVASN
jgi:hypothetical protein